MNLSCSHRNVNYLEKKAKYLQSNSARQLFFAFCFTRRPTTSMNELAKKKSKNYSQRCESNIINLTTIKVRGIMLWKSHSGHCAEKMRFCPPDLHFQLLSLLHAKVNVLPKNRRWNFNGFFFARCCLFPSSDRSAVKSFCIVFKHLIKKKK